jgi:hypothetical protein
MLAKRSFSLLVLLTLVANILVACATIATPAEQALEIDAEPQNTPTQEVTPTNTIDLQATADAQSTAEAIMTVDAQKTADAEATTTAIAVATQKIIDFRATSTQDKAIKQTATAEVNLQSTAQAESMAERLIFLGAEGVVANTNGEYIRLAKFDESWAQMNWFQWWSTGYTLENFAIRTDLAWSSASETANWFSSGCGFVFGLDDKKNFHVLHLRLDGFVTLKYWLNGNGNWIAQRPAGKISTPDGQGEILMVVYDKRVTFYLDGEQVLSEYASLLKPGELAMTLVSGTNKDYGTRCKMTDVDLWVFK